MPNRPPLRLIKAKGMTTTRLVGSTYSIVHRWRSGASALPEFATLTRTPITDSGFILRVEECVPVHETLDLLDQEFADSWQRVRDYVDERRRLLGIGDACRQLTEDEVRRLDESLPGAPPPSFYPIYFVTICEPLIRLTAVTPEGNFDSRLMYRHAPSRESKESVVYVGKTVGENRFRNGHHAFTKLHQPQFDGFEKWLYRCRLVLRQAGDVELPLEWVHERRLAESLLGDAEGQLIRAFDPDLNERNEKVSRARSFAIINLATDSPVLDGVVGFVTNGLS